MHFKHVNDARKLHCCIFIPFFAYTNTQKTECISAWKKLPQGVSALRIATLLTLVMKMLHVLMFFLFSCHGLKKKMTCLIQRSGIDPLRVVILIDCFLPQMGLL